MNYYIGVALASNSALDSGVTIIDKDNNIILSDKLYKVNDIIFFFENYSALNYSKICVSLPYDKTMLEGKWRVLAKPYQLVATNPYMPNRANWTQRYALRGSEFFKELNDKGIEVNRFELFLTRQSMHLNSCYKERSPADCNFLQQTLKLEYGFDLPNNMMPMSQLEALVGAMLAKEQANNPENIKKLFTFKNLNVIDINKVKSRI